MYSIMYSIIRQLLFALPPELSHDLSMDLINASGRLCLSDLFLPAPIVSPVNIMGLNFPNAVGLAAGLDKNADSFDALGSMGFGFVEVGTITPRPQSGNPKPRLFRIPEAQAIINRMGFNNKGVSHLVQRVSKRSYDGILGINIGKNFDTPVEQASEDYIVGLRQVYSCADYITVNISSPNTPGLRDLQQAEKLRWLLQPIARERSQLSDRYDRYVPIAVKIAPDMDDEGLKNCVEEVQSIGMDAIIATNTTLDKDAVMHFFNGNEQGGLSGAPLYNRSNEVIECLYQVAKEELPIIGVGGISSAKHAQDKIKAGAKLVQIYTGFIYQGPKLINDCAKAIAELR